MAVETIVVYVDLSRHMPARIRAAASLGLIHGAHLLGVAMTGIPPPFSRTTTTRPRGRSLRVAMRSTLKMRSARWIISKPSLARCKFHTSGALCATSRTKD